MNHRSCPRERVRRPIPAKSSPEPHFTEPQTRRWTHKSESDPGPQGEQESALHYLRCSLSYQNQALADIKALLEQLVQAQSAHPEEPQP